MDFRKDILLIDCEFSGFDINKHDLLQLAAVLLDKKTLKEKKVFSSYIRPSHWKHRDRESMAVNKISFNMVRAAPKLQKVIRLFDKTFGRNVILSSYVGFNDKRFLMDAYQKAKIKMRFDYHYFDLWGLFYSFLAARNKLKSRKDFAGFGLEDLIKMFKISVKGGSASGGKIFGGHLHDALVDCRVEAEVLRKVVRIIS